MLHKIWLLNVIIIIHGLLTKLPVKADMLVADDGPFAGYILETSKINDFHPSYMGCFQEGFSDAESFPHAVSLPSISIVPCIDYCRQQKFTFAGLKEGRLCVCGDRHYQEYSENCRNDEVTSCTGDRSEVCGGEDGATSVYRVCEPDKYGAECTQDCTCLDNGCYMNGTCIRGCGVGKQPGTVHKGCIDGCPRSFFGLGCLYDNPNCKDKLVHPLNGFCISGCSAYTKGISLFCSTGSGTVAVQNPDGEACPICEHCIPKHCYGNGYVFYYHKCPLNWTGEACTGVFSKVFQNEDAVTHSRIGLPECEKGYWGDFCNRRCAADCSCAQNGPACVQCNKRGVYGPMCDLPCPVNCLNAICHPKTGKCDCVLGAHGEMCDECLDGLYGRLCDEKCPDQCEGACDKLTGKCIDGCKNGFYGIACDKDCPNCKSGCGRSNGSCFECTPGYYGVYCMDPCPPCKGACDREDGKCRQGCRGGLDGPYCSIVREPPQEAVEPTKVLGLSPLYLCMIAYGVLVAVVVSVFIGMLHKKPPKRKKYKVPEIKIENVDSGSSKASILSKFSFTVNTETFSQTF